MEFFLLKQLIERVNFRHTIKKSDGNTANITKYNNKLDDVQIRNAHHSSLDKKGVTHLGSGSEAVVFQNTTKAENSGVVTKWIRNQRTPYNENPAIIFLIHANKHGNPFAPVVYNIKQISNQNGTFDYYIKMEKLHKTLLQMKDNIEQPQIDAFVRQVVQDYDSYPLSLYQLAGIIRNSAVEEGVEINGKRYEYTEKLAEICDIINLVVMKYHGRLDLAARNIMIRLTSVGMQLVLNDPIYTGS